MRFIVRTKDLVFCNGLPQGPIFLVVLALNREALYRLACKKSANKHVKHGILCCLLLLFMSSYVIIDHLPGKRLILVRIQVIGA